MSNLYTGIIPNDGEYYNLEELTEIIFEENNTYTIEFSNSCYVREGETGKGFKTSGKGERIQFTKQSDDLYVKARFFDTEINIAS